MDFLTSPIPEVFIQGSIFVFSGNFRSCTPMECEQATRQAGGLVTNKIDPTIDYLVVGDLGNPNWKFKTYGRKIEEAVECNKSTKTKIKIISEDIWLEALKDRKKRTSFNNSDIIYESKNITITYFDYNNYWHSVDWIQKILERKHPAYVTYEGHIKPFLENLLERELPSDITYKQTKELFKIYKNKTHIFSIAYSLYDITGIITPSGEDLNILTGKGTIYKKIGKKLSKVLLGKDIVPLTNIQVTSPSSSKKLKPKAPIEKIRDGEGEPDFFTNPVPKITVQGKLFFFLGKFQCGEHTELQNAIRQLGGNTVTTISNNLDYLVYGEIEKINYRFSKPRKCGPDIENALKVNVAGGHIAIISEENWLNTLRNRYSNTDSAHIYNQDLGYSYHENYVQLLINRATIRRITWKGDVLPLLEEIIESRISDNITYATTKQEFKIYKDDKFILSVGYGKYNITRLKNSAGENLNIYNVDGKLSKRTVSYLKYLFLPEEKYQSTQSSTTESKEPSLWGSFCKKLKNVTSS